jgi:hypothetical protein
MPSPFPGMNPFLEQEDAWHDYHESFMPLARDLLAAQVRPAYLVKIDEHVYIHELPEEQRHLLGRGDVTLARGRDSRSSQGSGAVLEGPARVRLGSVDVESHSSLEIRDRESRRLVTVIELLSPSNKNPSADRDQYLGRRRQLLRSNVHFVEIDLLRGGPRMPMEGLPPCDYCVLVSQVETRPEAEAWPVGLRARLPVIPIPLQSPDSPARLDLQVVLNRIYDSAGYEDYIYRNRPQPPLSGEDEAWAREVVAAAPSG